MHDILLPVFIQVALTFVVLLLLPGARVKWMKENREIAKGAASNNNIYDGKAKVIGNNLTNQFETPVLFYAVVAFAMITDTAGTWMVWLAWAFVVFRSLHAMIHLGANVVKLRFACFLASTATLLTMWVLLFCRIYLQG